MARTKNTARKNVIDKQSLKKVIDNNDDTKIPEDLEDIETDEKVPTINDTSEKPKKPKRNRKKSDKKKCEWIFREKNCIRGALESLDLNQNLEKDGNDHKFCRQHFNIITKKLEKLADNEEEQCQHISRKEKKRCPFKKENGLYCSKCVVYASKTVDVKDQCDFVENGLKCLKKKLKDHKKCRDHYKHDITEENMCENVFVSTKKRCDRAKIKINGKLTKYCKRCNTLINRSKISPSEKCKFEKCTKKKEEGKKFCKTHRDALTDENSDSCSWEFQNKNVCGKKKIKTKEYCNRCMRYKEKRDKQCDYETSKGNKCTKEKQDGSNRCEDHEGKTPREPSEKESESSIDSEESKSKRNKSGKIQCGTKKCKNITKNDEYCNKCLKEEKEKKKEKEEDSDSDDDTIGMDSDTNEKDKNEDSDENSDSEGDSDDED